MSGGRTRRGLRRPLLLGAAGLAAGVAAAIAWPRGGAEGPVVLPPGPAAALERPAAPARLGSAELQPPPPVPRPRSPPPAPSGPAVRAAGGDSDRAAAHRPVAWPRKEKHYLAEYRGWAGADPASFAEEARERLAAPDAPLAEKAGLLRAGAEADRVLGDKLFAIALAPELLVEPEIRELAIRSLIERAKRDPAALERLHQAAVLERRLPADLRRRAAHAVFSRAPERELDRLIAEVERAQDEEVFLAALHSLASNPAPRAREILTEIAATRTWDPAAQAAASEAAAAAEGAASARR